MQGAKIAFSFHIPGTLAADIAIRFSAPEYMTLVHVSAVASNNSDATLKLGDSTDDDGYISAFAVGDSGTPVVKQAFGDFSGALAGGQYPRIRKGDIVLATLDYDGASGTAAQNVTIVLTFTEG